MRIWKKPTKVPHHIFLKKLKLNKHFLSTNKNLLTHRKEPMYIQLATEFFEIIYMDREELMTLIKLVPVDNKHILDNNIVYINYRRIQEKINGLQLITFYKDQLVTDNKIKLINFYLDEFTINYLNAHNFSESLMLHAYHRWIIKHHIF